MKNNLGLYKLVSIDLINKSKFEIQNNFIYVQDFDFSFDEYTLIISE